MAHKEVSVVLLIVATKYCSIMYYCCDVGVNSNAEQGLLCDGRDFTRLHLAAPIQDPLDK